MAGEDEEYREWICAQRCSKCGSGAPSVCHHMTGAGMGLRAHDHASMPLCWSCHGELHRLTGSFKGWTKGQLREWQQVQVDYHRRIYTGDLPF